MEINNRLQVEFSVALELLQQQNLDKNAFINMCKNNALKDSVKKFKNKVEWKSDVFPMQNKETHTGSIYMFSPSELAELIINTKIQAVEYFKTHQTYPFTAEERERYLKEISTISNNVKN